MRVIRDKVAVVTGAASGIGRAIALKLAREGAHLHLVDIDLLGAQAVADEARRAGQRIVVTQCDLARMSEVDHLAAAIRAEWGAIDILVNNAGVAWYGPMIRMSDAEWDRVLAVNLHAPIRLTTKLLPVLLGRPEAHVLNIASINGWVCGSRTAAYEVSKFGLVGFSEALRAEFGRQGLGVTAVCPGPVLTNLFKNTPCSHSQRVETPMPPAWLCTTADRVAAAAISAIRRNQAVRIVGWSALLLYYAKRFAPWVFYAIHTAGRNRRLRAKLALLGEYSKDDHDYSARQKAA
jgi:NAD(P)-dependent dehydrogenase (short-subunit alcohol dehydrogenase family)